LARFDYLLKWYGFKNFFYERIIDNCNKNLKKKKKKNSLFFKKRIGYNKFRFKLFLPINWNFLLLKKKSSPHFMYLYSPNFFFFLPLPFKFLMFDYNRFLNVLSFSFFFKNNFFSIFFRKIKLLFFGFTLFFFKKLKFKGKGYYVYKNNRNTIAFQFGYSHIKRLFFYFSYVKFLSKTSILIFGFNSNNVDLLANCISKVRPVGIFTGRGMRFVKQIVYRKTGKLSSYR